MADPIVTITNGVPTSGSGQITTLGQVLDPTNGPAAIKAASTAPAATDKALVVGIHPLSTNANGQKTSINSSPVVLPSDQTFAGQNAAAPANGVMAGGQFNTAPTTLVSGNVSPLQLDSAGNLLVNIKAPATVPVSGTVTTTPPANASTNLTQVGGSTVLTGTGLSGLGVPRVTVSSDSSVSLSAALPAGANAIGSVSVSNFPAGAATAANQPTNAAQGAAVAGVTGNAVFANATTAAPVYTTATVNPLSMDTSGNLRVAAASLPLPTGAATAANQTIGFADVSVALAGMTALNGATQIALAGSNSVAVLLTGTWVGTLVPEVSVDGGTTWVATQFYNVNTHAASNTATANGTYDIMGTGGKSHARVRLSAFTSGTVTGNLRASSQAPSATDSEILLNTTTAGSIPAGSALIGGVSVASPYPGNPTPAAAITGNATGTTLAVTGTLAAAAAKTTYISGFNVSSAGGAATSGPITVAGLVGTSMVFQIPANAANAPVNFTMTFNPPIPASATNTAITIATTANGTATAVDVNSWGFQL